MLKIEREEKKRNKLMIFLIKHTYTQQKNIQYNLPPVVPWQWRQINGGQGEKQVTPGQTYTHAQHKTIQ